MKIKKVIDDKILIEWYDFNAEKNVGGIIMHERYIRDVKTNNGIVIAVGQDVKEVKVGDYVMYAINPIHMPFDTDDGRRYIAIEKDVLAILEED